MRRHIWGLGTLLVVAALGLGAWVAQSVAQDGALPAATPRTLNVSGVGVVNAVPDVLQATIGVETENANLAAALGENNARIAAVLELLGSLGVAERDVQTTDFFISETRDREGVLTGFRVVNNVRITLRDLDGAGAILDQLVQGGANRVFGIQLALSNADQQLSQARALAVQNAFAKARELAQAAGMFLGNPLTINEGGGYVPVAEVRAASLAYDGGVPVAAGELSVTVNVSITFEMF